MARQFVVKKNDSGGYDLWLRSLVSIEEYRQRFNHLVTDCKLTPDEASVELYKMVATFEKKTQTSTATLNMCKQYVYDFSEPLDIIVIDNHKAIVSKLART
jgi:hypothetical protein